MRLLLLLTFSFFVACNALAQYKDLVWCFGDSAGIDFTQNPPQPVSTSVKGRGSCASISDSNGNLLFYAFVYSTGVTNYCTQVFNKNHQLMQNGSNIIGQGLYNELTIVPIPGQPNSFYLFSISVVTPPPQGLFYSIIDLNQNGGLGAVIQKNQMINSFPCADGLTAIKHGNGRDWWVFFRRGYQATNDFYLYKISPTGIDSAIIQSVGNLSHHNSERIVFSPDGNRFVKFNYLGLVELFDFNRCTGIISNPITLDNEDLNRPKEYASGEFSASGRFFYINSTPLDTCSLYQFDLYSPNIAQSKQLIYSFYPEPDVWNVFGLEKRGPDNKIYISRGYYSRDNPYFFPYPDTMYNNVNMNLCVINHPDSIGLACDFQPHSFFLGGNRTYAGLPNNPKYDLGPVVGAPATGVEPGP